MIDLHCHSTASDGRLSPSELVTRALERGLSALALTDHDTVGGLDEFHRAGKEKGLETISGVEVSATFPKGTMHILGLLIDPKHAGFREFLGKLAEGRKVRNPQIIDKLRELGMDITMAEVEAEAGLKDDGPGGGAVDKSVGRPHIASVLIRKGYAKDKQEVFDKLLAKGAPAYFSRFTASPEESIAQIHAAGGLAVLAHPPYLLKEENEVEMDSIVGGLKTMGLDGIEVLYSTHSPHQTHFIAGLAQKYDLAPSGGSDFHGEPAVKAGDVAIDLGVGKGNLKISDEILANLKRLQAVRNR